MRWGKPSSFPQFLVGLLCASPDGLWGDDDDRQTDINALQEHLDVELSIQHAGGNSIIASPGAICPLEASVEGQSCGPPPNLQIVLQNLKNEQIFDLSFNGLQDHSIFLVFAETE